MDNSLFSPSRPLPRGQCGEEAVGGYKDTEAPEAVDVLGQLHQGVVPHFQHLQLPDVQDL